MGERRFSFVALIGILTILACVAINWNLWRSGFVIALYLGFVFWIARMRVHSGTDSMRERVAGKKLNLITHQSSISDTGYYWAGRNISFEEACRHFVAVGATGSGKSITLNLLMQSVFQKMRGSANFSRIKRRALVYDAKADLVSFLAGIVPESKIKILNPLDTRFSPWDMASDLTTETDAYEFASILIPKNEKESSPYFTDTARALVTGVIKRLNASCPLKWKFRHLVLAFETKERLKSVLDHEETRYLMDHFDPDNAKNFAGVKSTVDNTMAMYRPIAAFFDAATSQSISLRKWVESEESILVLGNHESAREATDTLNRLIFRQLSKFIIARDGKIQNEETWIFLDEIREAGVLSGLRQLLLRGRSKGVAVALGFQDVEGMYAAYGQHEGAEIIGAAQNAVVLHINPTSPKTTEWASSVFGKRRDLQRSIGTQKGEKDSNTDSIQLALEENLLPIQFCELPMPTKKEGLKFYGCSNAEGLVECTYPWNWLTSTGPLSIASEECQNFNGHTGAVSIKLKPWNDSDDRLIGLKLNALHNTIEKVHESNHSWNDIN